MWTHIRNITQSEKLGTEGEILQTFFKLNSTTGNINLCSEKPERWFPLVVREVEFVRYWNYLFFH